MAEANSLSSRTPSVAPAAHSDSDVRARRLAYLTVGIPALGFALAIAYTWIYGMRTTDFVLLALMYFSTAIGVETGMHRYFSHRSFKGRPVVTVLLGVLGSMAAQGPILFWAATHRMHHAFTDQDGDPHSPLPRVNRRGRTSRLAGLWHGHVGWLFTVRRENWSAYAADLLRDRLIVNLNLRYGWWVLLGLAIPTLAGALLAPAGQALPGAVGGFLWGGLARIFLLDQSTWAVNSLCHTIGTRPHPTRDHSRNFGLLAIVSVGGAWHNNHHAQPAFANNDHAFWQLDPSAWFIRLLDALGLVSEVRDAPTGRPTAPSSSSSTFHQRLETPMTSSNQNALGVMAGEGLSAANRQIPGVSPLKGSGARIKRYTALAVMLVPLAGFALAARQLALGDFAVTDLVLFAVFYFLQMGGITMGFHRYLAHKTFRTSKWFEALLLICGSMAAQGPIMFWVTMHRRHHLYSDQHGDPHSPNLAGAGLFAKLRGLWYAHMPWMLAPDASGWTFFAPDVLRDRRLFFYHRTYAWWIVLGLALPAAIGGAMSGSWHGAWNGLLFGGFARIFLANQAAWCVGSVCHMFGGRPFRTDDNSANNWTVAVLTFGEGLQNNHHAFPASYRHSVKWYEPDLSAWVLWTLGKAGVVWDLRSPGSEAIRKLAKQPH